MFTPPRSSRSNVKNVCAALVAWAALSLTGTAQAVVITYDVADDFSIASNPNGVWTYGSQATLGGALSLYTSSGTSYYGLEFWTTSVAVDFYNPTGSTINSGTAPIPAGAAAFHPGQNGEYSVYRFTAPSSGTYNLDVTFTGYDIYGGTNGDGTDVHVRRGSTSLYSGTVFGYTDTESYSSSLLLAANDFIDFAVGYGTSNYLYDTTGIAATLTTDVATNGGGNSVPEPASLALLGIGLAGFAVARRRKTS